jgi:hypothetical protein
LKDFEFYKTIRLSKNDRVKKSFPKLHNIYNSIPETKGCIENINKKDGCKGHCCKFQVPQILYSEFLLLWDYICKNWTDEEICDLFERCMVTAVNELPSKCCVLFDEKKFTCMAHKKRSYNCRIYSITPDEEFNPRYEKLKKEYDKIIGSVIFPQCNLVSTCDGSKITTEDTDRWWNKIIEVERYIGIPENMINDEMGGSYRTPHDHILLYNMPENVLNSLAGIKMYEKFEDRVKAVQDIISCIKKHFKGISKNVKSNKS